MQFRFQGLIRENGWICPAYVRTDDSGIIISISDKPAEGEATEAIDGYALPGFINAHSHAFQYAMAGEAEFFPPGKEEDFWSWREAMYRYALSLHPDHAEAVAAMVYAEMIRHGYTHVAEFHYLHHDPEGKPYVQLAEMGHRMLRAAEEAGIGITLIPVFYQQGGFGIAPYEGQRRFICAETDQYFRLFEETSSLVSSFKQARLGWSIHSLRAAEPRAIPDIFRQMPDHLPFHIHAAEQLREVSDCVDHCGQRPVKWLLENLPVNDKFFIVHATHMDDDELKGLAVSGASAVLCPGTEGNLGDGFFNFGEYVHAGGNWCIGTDSHITLDPIAELRMIDYRQRLRSNRRDTFTGDSAHHLIFTSMRNGRRAVGMEELKSFQAGQPFDAVVYAAQAPRIAVANNDNRLAAILYTTDSSHVTGTLRNGAWVVRNGVHVRGRVIKERFIKAIRW